MENIESVANVLSSIVENVSNPFCMIDNEGKFIRYNQALKNFWLSNCGVEIEMGKDFCESFIHEKLCSEAKLCLSTALDQGAASFFLSTNSDAVAQYEFVVKRVVDYGQHVVGLTIETRSQYNSGTQADLLSLDDGRFGSVLLNSADSVTITRVDDGDIIAVNKGFENTFGYSSAELRAVKMPQLHLWCKIEDRDALRHRLMHEYEVRDFETQMKTRSGTILDVVMTVRLMDVAGGKYMFTIARDVTSQKRSELSLLQREAELSVLINTIPDLVWLKNTDGVYLRCNKRFEDFFGATEEHIIGKTDYDFTTAEVADFFRAHDKNAISAGGPTKNEEWVLFAADGHRELLETIKTPMYNKYGVLGGVLGIGRDITQRYEFERQLLRSEKMFKTIFETGPDIITLTRLSDGVYENINERFVEVLGYSRDEIVGFSSLDKNIWFDDSDRCLLVDILAKSGVAYNLEFRFIAKGGELVYGSMSAKVIELEGELKMLGITRPTNDLRDAKEALRTTEELLSVVFGSMKELLVILDARHDIEGLPACRVKECNEAFAKLFDSGIDDLHGKSIGYLDSNLYELVHESFNRIARVGHSDNFEYYFSAKELNFIVSVLHLERGIYALLMTDITVLKQAQYEIEEKNKELENYLYAASHDLRSPLVNIQGFSQRLSKQLAKLQQQIKSGCDGERLIDIEEVVGNEIPKSLGFILNGVHKMDRLISGLLEISRTGRLPMVVEQIDMTAFMQDVVKGFEFELAESEIVLTVCDLPDCYGDRNQLSRLFANLISNAMKYKSDLTQAQITITGYSQGLKSIYEIADNGIGIPKKSLLRIWDVFFRAHPDLLNSGDGIGLSLVKTIVSKHKGKVEVDSEEGVGSCFRVYLQGCDFSFMN